MRVDCWLRRRSCSKMVCARDSIGFNSDWPSKLERRSFSRRDELSSTNAMAVTPPSVVAWSSQAELDQLKSWFYDPQPSNYPGQPSVDMRQRAVQRVCSSSWRDSLIPGPSISNSRNESSPRDSLNSASNSIPYPSVINSPPCLPYKHDARSHPLRQ